MSNTFDLKILRPPFKTRGDGWIRIPNFYFDPTRQVSMFYHYKIRQRRRRRQPRPLPMTPLEAPRAPLRHMMHRGRQDMCAACIADGRYHIHRADKPCQKQTRENRPGKNRPGNQGPGKQRPGKQRPGKQRPGKQRPGKAETREAETREAETREKKTREKSTGKKSTGKNVPS